MFDKALYQMSVLVQSLCIAIVVANKFTIILKQLEYETVYRTVIWLASAIL